MQECLSGADFMFLVRGGMEVKISIRVRGFAIDVDQKFSVIERNEGVKKG